MWPVRPWAIKSRAEMSAVTAAFPGSGHASRGASSGKMPPLPRPRPQHQCRSPRRATYSDEQEEESTDQCAPRGEAAATRRMILLARGPRYAYICLSLGRGPKGERHEEIALRHHDHDDCRFTGVGRGWHDGYRRRGLQGVPKLAIPCFFQPAPSHGEDLCCVSIRAAGI